MNIKNNKGIVLISFYMVIAVLLTLTLALGVRNVSDVRAVDRESDAIRAVYAAEKGIEYAFFESQNAGWGWYTHRVDINDDNNDGETTDLITIGDPDSILGGFNYNISTDHYEIVLGSGDDKVEVKAYDDPDNPGETIVLSRGTVNSSSRIIKSRINIKSLYEYFMFWPTDWSPGYYGYEGKKIDGNNVGSLHINGDLPLTTTSSFNNFAEISVSGNIYYYYGRQFSRPVDFDSQDGIPDGRAPLPRNNYPPYNYIYPESGRSPNVYIYGNSVSDDWDLSGERIIEYGWVKVNGLRIPKQLPDNPPSWEWDKYRGDPDGAAAVRFEVDQDVLEWLIKKEVGAGEYAISETDWLASGDDNNDDHWGNYEFDTVTVLSIETEAGAGPGAGSSNPDGYQQGLYNHTEYEIYQAVEKYEKGEVGWDNGLNANIRDWIADDLEDRAGFFDWWRQRSYHHRQNLGSQGGSFFGDKATVPAWERIFWEAWLNYWPPARGKDHQEIYTPASSHNALNDEWWNDLEYGNDRPIPGDDDLKLEVRYLNTTTQGAAFSNWLENQEYAPGKNLKGVIKYENYDGEYEQPLAIEANYADYAQGNGLYIKEGIGGSFSVVLNGGEPVSGGSLLAALGNAGITWISEAKFYNTAETNKDYDVNDPGFEEADLAISVIEIDVEALKNSATGINNRIIYIESSTYDTRLINGAELPEGGFTLVSPYDVYIKAQEKDIDGTIRYVFNYEAADKINSEDPDDPYFQPMAVISNSRVYFLSSEFKDFDPDQGDEYPYPYRFPNYPYSLREDLFLQEYAWEVWPGGDFPDPPALRENLDWAWVQVNLDGSQRRTLLNAGEGEWDNENENKMTNEVTQDNYFNVAVASPEDPRGYRRERWNGKLNVEGSFIKLKDKWAAVYRNHKSPGEYEAERFNLSSYPERAAYYRYWLGAQAYEYEERFWSADMQPAGDFLVGSRSGWQLVDQFNYNN